MKQSTSLNFEDLTTIADRVLQEEFKYGNSNSWIVVGRS